MAFSDGNRNNGRGDGTLGGGGRADGTLTPPVAPPRPTSPPVVTYEPPSGRQNQFGEFKRGPGFNNSGPNQFGDSPRNSGFDNTRNRFGDSPRNEGFDNTRNRFGDSPRNEGFDNNRNRFGGSPRNEGFNNRTNRFGGYGYNGGFHNETNRFGDYGYNSGFGNHTNRFGHYGHNGGGHYGHGGYGGGISFGGGQGLRIGGLRVGDAAKAGLIGVLTNAASNVVGADLGVGFRSRDGDYVHVQSGDRGGYGYGYGGHGYRGYGGNDYGYDRGGYGGRSNDYRYDRGGYNRGGYGGYDRGTTLPGNDPLVGLTDALEAAAKSKDPQRAYDIGRAYADAFHRIAPSGELEIRGDATIGSRRGEAYVPRGKYTADQFAVAVMEQLRPKKESINAVLAAVAESKAATGQGQSQQAPQQLPALPTAMQEFVRQMAIAQSSPAGAVRDAALKAADAALVPLMQPDGSLLLGAGQFRGQTPDGKPYIVNYATAGTMAEMVNGKPDAQASRLKAMADIMATLNKENVGAPIPLDQVKAALGTAGTGGAVQTGQGAGTTGTATDKPADTGKTGEGATADDTTQTGRRYGTATFHGGITKEEAPSIDAGYVKDFQNLLGGRSALPKHGADGKWGRETQAAFLSACAKAGVKPEEVSLLSPNSDAAKKLAEHLHRVNDPKLVAAASKAALDNTPYTGPLPVVVPATGVTAPTASTATPNKAADEVVVTAGGTKKIDTAGLAPRVALTITEADGAPITLTPKPMPDLALLMKPPTPAAVNAQTLQVAAVTNTAIAPSGENLFAKLSFGAGSGGLNDRQALEAARSLAATGTVGGQQVSQGTKVPSGFSGIENAAGGPTV